MLCVTSFWGLRNKELMRFWRFQKTKGRFRKGSGLLSFGNNSGGKNPGLMCLAVGHLNAWGVFDPGRFGRWRTACVWLALGKALNPQRIHHRNSYLVRGNIETERHSTPRGVLANDGAFFVLKRSSEEGKRSDRRVSLVPSPIAQRSRSYRSVNWETTSLGP